MKKYLADLLTFSRLILSIVLIILAFTSTPPEVAFTIFIIAELTDAFDGTLATKYPFPKNHIPKYRRYAALYDMLADALAAFAMALFFILKINWLAGLIMAIAYIVAAIIIDLIVYGRLFGHPDTAKPHSLIFKNFKLAKTIILIRRNIYLMLLAIIATWTLYASTIPLAVKIAITIIAIMISIGLWFFLAQRRHHISRDAVNLEKKLEKMVK